MPIEFQVSLEDKPGSLAWLGSVIGDADINFDAIEARSGRGVTVVHFVASDTKAAAAALEESGIPYGKREVVVVNILDQPGTLGDVALVMSEAGINIDCGYVTVRGDVVLGVDDVEGATQVASGMAVMTEE